MTVQHPDYAVLAARIAISNLHKETKKMFSDVISDLYTYGRRDFTRAISIKLIQKLTRSEPKE